jgi:UDP-glucose 4-epimerase
VHERSLLRKLIITGALGHIGSKLIESLDSESFEPVVLIDNFKTERYCSVFNLPSIPKFRLIEADILTFDFRQLLQPDDVVIHLAAITNAEASVAMAEEVRSVNFDGTVRLAECCAAKRARLIFVSTTSVYGQQQDEVAEDCPIEDLRPQSPYAASKLEAEQRLVQLGAKLGLRFVICRFGTVFGPSKGMRFHTAVNKFIWQACMGIDLTVWSMAMNQKRPYLDLEDAIRALKFIMSNDLFDGSVYNVLTLNTSVKDLVDRISQFVPDVRVKLVDSPIMNQLSYCVSNARFRKAGFQFTGDLDKAIRATVGMLRNARSFS